MNPRFVKGLPCHLRDRVYEICKYNSIAGAEPDMSRPSIYKIKNDKEAQAMRMRTNEFEDYTEGVWFP